MFSLKVATRSALRSTSVASLAGDKEDKVGTVCANDMRTIPRINVAVKSVFIVTILIDAQRLKPYVSHSIGNIPHAPTEFYGCICT